MNSKLYFNGNIITMENDLKPEALLTQGKDIIFVGTREEAMKKAEGAVEEIDLKGNTLLPGFIDSHSHILAFAMTLSTVSLSGVNSIQALQQRIIDYIQDKKPMKGSWIRCFGYDHNDFKNKQHPTKEDLDQITTQYPLLISHQSGHMGVLNSAALQELGINRNTPNPEGGKIGRDKYTNELNGYLEETAFTSLTQEASALSITEIQDYIKEAQRVYLSCGITTAQEGIVKTNDWKLLKELAENNNLILDIVTYIDIKDNSNLVKRELKYINQYHQHLKIGGYKLFLDGSPQGKTAWMQEPYEDERNEYKGYPIYQDVEIEKWVKQSLAENMQLITHCNGDAACEQLIRVFEKASYGKKVETRPVMIHGQFVKKEQLRRMHKIPMIVSFFLIHIYYWAKVHEKNLGNRVYRMSPTRSAIESDVVVTLHQDSPVLRPDMIKTLDCAVNRLSKEGICINPNEKVSIKEALKMITLNGAYSYFEEELKGTLSPGKRADMVILNQNPIISTPQDIKSIQILNTIKDGEVVFSS